MSDFWYCTPWIPIARAASLSSALVIISMTFDRFYSIIKPHKSASFNTVKRAKINIACILVFSVSYNLPHFFTTTRVDQYCAPFGHSTQYVSGMIYYWISLVINILLPFVSLLIMNSVIIHTLRERSGFQGQIQGREQGGHHTVKIKGSERQIYITLLLVTFTFLILSMPSYTFIVYAWFYDYKSSPRTIAASSLWNSIAHQTLYTNYAINFFLYVISGKKFRQDLVSLFKCFSKGNSTGENIKRISNLSELPTPAANVS